MCDLKFLSYYLLFSFSRSESSFHIYSLIIYFYNVLPHPRSALVRIVSISRKLYEVQVFLHP